MKRGQGAPRTTISRELNKFKKTKNPKFFFSAVGLLLRSGRLSEVAYGAICFVFRPPSRVADPPIKLEGFVPELRAALDALRAERNQVLGTVSQEAESSGEPLYCMDHGFALTEDGAILGEYANYSARLFHVTASGVCAHDDYQRRETVRHIHLVHRSGRHVYVATGDTDKFLDEWDLDGEKLTFTRRILKRFGGFTTVCETEGKTYFGSDFSERPNYIWCLETGQKWFFPKPAYARYCYLMLLAQDRYIVCFHRGLSKLSGGIAYSIFDPREERFVGAGEYVGDVFVSDYVEPDVWGS